MDGRWLGPRVEPGRMIFLPGGLSHTHRAAGPGDAVYLVLKWQGKIKGNSTVAKAPVQFRIGSAMDAVAADRARDVELGGFAEVAGRQIDKLMVHQTRLANGAALPRHSDAHDLAVVLLRGSVETPLGAVSAPAVSFYRAGMDHWHRQTGPEPASYLAIEFHANRRPRAEGGA